MKTFLTHADVVKRVERLAEQIRDAMRLKLAPGVMSGLTVYPVPRGGVPVAYLLKQHGTLYFADKPEQADFIVDDIIDSGATQRAYAENYPDTPFFALVDKIKDKCDEWVVFPWEHGEAEGSGIEDNVRRLIQYAGDDPSREGLLETPARVAKAWDHWTSGYGQSAADLLKVFEDGAADYDEMVLVRDIPIYSKCEHHLADIFGTVSIAYIPNGKIVGLSKLSRLADMYARRLQVQERLTVQIADALVAHLQPKGVGVLVRARHMCMESRGICQQGHHTVTTALRGAIRDDASARAEFLSACG